jgi:hypothetical protein
MLLEVLARDSRRDPPMPGRTSRMWLNCLPIFFQIGGWGKIVSLLIVARTRRLSRPVLEISWVAHLFVCTLR